MKPTTWADTMKCTISGHCEADPPGAGLGARDEFCRWEMVYGASDQLGELNRIWYGISNKDS